MSSRFALCRTTALVLSAAILVLIGCRDDDKPPAPPTVDGSNPPDSSTRPDPPARDEGGGKLMAHWPTDRLEGALIFTGQMFGYLEPCGCAAGQKGGLVRRATFIERLEAQGWDLGLLDLGSLANDQTKARGGPLQTKLEFATALNALDRMDYDGIALSAEDLRLGTVDMLMELVNTLPGGQDGPKVLAANARPLEGLGFEERVRPSDRLQVGATRVGVTAVLDPQAFADLADTTKAEFLTVDPPEESLPAVLSDLETDTDLQVLMVQGPPELATKLARAYPGFDIVVGTSRVPDPPAQPEVLNDGRTWLVTVGQKGMYLGVVGIYRDSEEKLRYQRIELNDRYDKDAELAAPIRALIDEELQNDLASANVLENYPRKPYALFDAAPGATYVGAETCKSCHAGTYAKWSSTPHAHAYEVLVSDPKRPGRNRENDASCVSCHTTGFGYVGGFVTAEMTPELENNQCENCHGPGSAHAAAPDDEAIRQTVARTKEFFSQNLDYGCIRCHDGDNDPHFEFDTYWPKVMHNGLDTYDDPEVHRGIEAPATP